MTDFVIAPGSRSAPLTLALADESRLTCRVVYDERSGGYLALGLAQQNGRPTGLVCTSGTAALNFAPAIAEAYYQQIPLLVLTADRPPEWLDQQDNQAIHQRGLYEPHCRGSFELPVDYAHRDARWHALRIVSEAIHRAQGLAPGPVHVNAPLREPLYDLPEPASPAGQSRQDEATERPPKRIHRLPARPQLTEEAWDRLTVAWNAAGPKLVLAGMHRPDEPLRAALATLGRQPDVAIVADVTANLFPAGSPLHRWDAVLGTTDPARLDSLRPDLAISFGGPIVSKHLRQLLRARAPRAHWHVHPAGDGPDTFQCLTEVAPMWPADFFTALAKRLPAAPQTQEPGYAATWRNLARSAGEAVAQFLEHTVFGEFQAMAIVMQALPAGSRLQIGNSLPIRYANFIACPPNTTLDRVDSNRGVSGIDGTVSTAVGAALATDRLTTLLVGDLGFFYDRNGLWHRHVPANLRIVVFNNHGGGIFDIVEGPGSLPRALQEAYFLTPQPLTAQHTAADHGLDYFHAATAAELRAILPAYFSPLSRAAVLEIETEMAVNSHVFRLFKAMLA